MPLVPAFDRLQEFRIAVVPPEGDQAIEPDPLRPLPGVEADVVAGGAIEIGLVEAPVMAQAGHALHEQVEPGTHMSCRLRHFSSLDR